MNAQKIARLVMAWCLLLVSATASAQVLGGGIAGVARDTSGAVLPGVTVEAASPALIEKVRTVVTDGQGLYRIVDLRPGPYTVTFTLPGFSTFKREGIELAAGTTATVNAEMKVGALEETITVSGEAPVVDTQTVREQTTLSRGTLDAIPGTGRPSQLTFLLPAATSSATDFTVGGVSDRVQTSFSLHGGPTAQPVVDGMTQQPGGRGVFIFNNLTTQEVVIEVSGTSAERLTGGAQMNIIPKDGGNTFSGSFVTTNSWPSLEGNNLSDALIARGLTPTSRGGFGSLNQLYDTGGALGGPIKRDKLWFFGASRFADYQQYQQGNYYNKLTSFPGLPPGVTFYEPDLNRPAYTDDWSHDYSLRLTWQATAKHRIAVADAVQPNCNCVYMLINPGSMALARPEATSQHMYNPNGLPSANWTFPATNRLLFEAGFSMNLFTNSGRPIPGTLPDTITINELSDNTRYGSNATALGNVGGSFTVQVKRSYHERFAASYVTGSHAFKTGMELHQYFLNPGPSGESRWAGGPNQIHQARSYTFRNQVPQSLTIWAVPFGWKDHATDVSAFVQDQWTFRRLTLNPGLRFSSVYAEAPEQNLPAGPFVPARTFAGRKNVPAYKNLNPRLGAAYDLFGNGKTALKASIGRYNPIIMNAVDNPAINSSFSTTRNWNDANGNYIPDCDLLNPATNGECGAWSDLGFGLPKTVTTRYATDALEGFNVQSYNGQGSVSVQHELRPNMALNVGYFRTWYGNFLVTDNKAVTSAAFDPYCVTAPVDSRLPNSGQSVCGFYDVKPASFGATDNLVTQASRYGTRTEVFNGVDATVNARFGQGGQVSGGLSVGRTVIDNCFLNDHPELSGSATQPRTQEFCHLVPPWSQSTQVRFLVVYPLPWGLQTSATYQNIPGIPITASYVATNAQVLPTLGRNLGSCRGAATCSGTVTVDLLPNTELSEPRLQDLDLRFSRLFRMGKAKVRANFDLYNILNGSSVLNETTRYSSPDAGQWQNVLQFMGGRLIRVGAQLDF